MKLSTQAKRMMRVIIIITFVAAIASLVYYRSKKAIPFLLGLFLGSATSVIRVLLLERLVNRLISEKKKSKASVQFGHLGRLLLAFAAMLVGALVEGISLLGVIVGVFSYQLATYTLRSTLTTNQKNSLDENTPDTEEKNRE